MRASSEIVLDPEALRRIELSLRRRLQVRRLSEGFIDRHLEDAVAQSLLDYVAAVRRGVEIQNAAGWIVTNATNRALDEARREALRQRPATIDLGAEALRDPDPVAERGLTRAALPQLFRAIRGLTPEDQQLLSSRFYEGKTTRETARELFVSETSVRRRSTAALAKLRALLGVEPSGSNDEFNSKLHGALAWLALGGGARVVPRRGPLRFVGDGFASARRAATESRGAEHLQRLLPYGGDGIGAAIKGPIGWAAGACAGAVALCAATGVAIGPVLSHHNGESSPPPAVAARREVAPAKPPPPVRDPVARPARHQVAPVTTSTPVAEAPVSSKTEPTRRTHSRRTTELKTHKRAKAKQSRAQTEVHQVEEETSGIARAAAESSPEEASPEVSASSSAAQAVAQEAVVVPSSSASSSKESGSSGEEQAKNEFGAFK